MFHVKHFRGLILITLMAFTIMTRDDFARAFDVSSDTLNKLEIFVQLLRKWQRAKNLISGSTLDEVWVRHIADSFQLLQQAPRALRWLDLGTGGGFPGLVMAIALHDRPEAEVHCVESNGRKCSFLREAARLTGAKAIIHNERIESAAVRFVGQIDIVTARALAHLSQLLLWAEPVLRKGAEGLFLKGEDASKELTESRQCLTVRGLAFDDALVPSCTDAKGRIVRISNVRSLT